MAGRLPDWLPHGRLWILVGHIMQYPWAVKSYEQQTGLLTRQGQSTPVVGRMAHLGDSYMDRQLKNAAEKSSANGLLVASLLL